MGARRLLVKTVAAAALVVAAGCIGPDAPEGPAPTTTLEPTFAPSDCLSVVSGLDLQRATIQDLQAAMTAGAVTSLQLVDAYVARIQAFDDAGPALNSVQGVSPTARAKAQALDEERAAGLVRGPLHGIPILLKDNVGTNDQPTTAGSIALADNIPPQDATLTARLREAGAVILGKTQLSEFANWMSLRMPNGYSSLGGQVVNAYTRGDPSGSSSGSGVAGSMALAAATIGTETSGSILSPSNANSLVGVKPTLGLVSRAGVIPLAASFDTPGPMVRSVHDAALLLSAISGPDERDPATGESGLPPIDYARLLSPNALNGVRLGYEPTSNPIFNKALEDLGSLGAELVPIEADPAEWASLSEIPLIFNEFKAGINAYLATEAGPGLPVSDLTEIILYNQEHPDKVRYGQDLLIASDASPGVAALMAPAATPTILASRDVADRYFAENDVNALVGLNAPYTSLGAAAGYPTVVVPAGYDGREPRGLSFFGPARSEPWLLSYAYAYEQATQHRVPPTEIDAALLDEMCGAPADDEAAPPDATARPFVPLQNVLPR